MPILFKLFIFLLDVIIFPTSIGKVFFLNDLFQHAAFITGGLDPPGSLAQLTSPENSHMGFLAFVRLVGCAYFKKHLSGFKFDTPEASFKSLTIPSLDRHHKEWLELIRTTVWERSYDESYYLPSYEALHLDWRRCAWVARYWGQSLEHNIQMPGLTLIKNLNTNLLMCFEYNLFCFVSSLKYI